MLPFGAVAVALVVAVAAAAVMAVAAVAVTIVVTAAVTMAGIIVGSHFHRIFCVGRARPR